MSLVSVAATHEGALLALTLSAPPANRLDAALLDELTRALDAADGRTRLIVFNAAGEQFSLGRVAGDADAVRSLHALFRRLMRLGLPTAAIVRGACLGAGLELAAFCNFIFAARDACFGGPESGSGFGFPSLVLPLKLGHGNAADLVLCGETIDAAEAYRRGLCTALAPAARLDALAAAWLDAHILDKQPRALIRANRAARLSFNTQLAAELLVVEAWQAKLVDDGTGAGAYSASNVRRLYHR